jgi:hypothetical protein
MIFFDIILIVAGIAIVIATVLYFVDGKGCGGDCYQGRRPCNCKRNERKE